MAKNAFGSKFQYYKNSVFVDVAEVTNISAPSVSRDSIETTNHGSADGFREFIPGLVDPGEVSIDINWNPANGSHGDIYGQLLLSENQQYKVVFGSPAVGSLTFTGHLTGFDATAPIDDRLTASLTFKISGKPTLL